MGKRYLIVKTSSLGDVVQTLPVLSYLKSIEPDCKIDWAVEKAGASLLEACSLIERVIVVDTKKWRSNPFAPQTWTEMALARKELRKFDYDAVFDLQGNMKSGLITFFAKSKLKAGFGKKSVPEFPNLVFTDRKVNLPDHIIQNISQDYLWIVSQSLGLTIPTQKMPQMLFEIEAQEKGLIDSIRGLDEKAILIAPGSAWENKRLSKAQLMSLIAEYRKEGSLFLAWGSEDEFKLCKALQEEYPFVTVLPKLSLPGLGWLMTKVNLVISVDSLALHLAAAAGVPTLSFFGPSSAAKYAPKGPEHRAIQGSCPYGETFDKRCRKLRTCPTGKCIKDICF